jgi:hypothetical protein
MFLKPKCTVVTRYFPLVFCIFSGFVSLFFLNMYVLPTQVYGTTVSCLPPTNRTNCEEVSSSAAVVGDPTLNDAETPLIIPDISPEMNDLSRSTVPDENLGATDPDLDDDSSSSDMDISTLDLDEDGENQKSTDDNTDSVAGESESGGDSGPSVLPFP